MTPAAGIAPRHRPRLCRICRNAHRRGACQPRLGEHHLTGARSRLTLRLEGDGASAAADAYCHRLEEREFDLSGHIVVDIAVKERSDESDARVRLTLEALTVEMD